jgi:hypothetical protein
VLKSVPWCSEGLGLGAPPRGRKRRMSDGANSLVPSLLLVLPAGGRLDSLTLGRRSRRSTRPTRGCRQVPNRRIHPGFGHIPLPLCDESPLP